MIKSSVQEFEDSIRCYPLTFDQLRDPGVEDMRFPSMRGVVRSLGDRLRRPPTQEEFTLGVIGAWQGPFPSARRQAVTARCHRAYASLIREQHFGLVLREACAGWPVNVLESEKLDLANGLDYLVTGEAGSVGIAVYQGTRRAWAFNKRKVARRAEGISVVAAELGVENRVMCGRFWLFAPSWVQDFAAREVLPLVVPEGTTWQRC